MILTAHQPTYLPWIGTFHKILLSDTFCFFDIAQYQKKEWDNRNKIYTHNGELMLSVPTKSQNHFDKTIGNICINNETSWAEKQYRSIFLNYKKHPFFDEHNPFLEDMYLNQSWYKLSDLNIHFYKYIIKLLDKDIKIIMASDLKLQGSKSNLVLDMCKKLNASTYVFGGEGKNYAIKDSFKENNISLIFQDYKHPVYKQYRNKGQFLPNLSILDLIMNYGKKDIRRIIMKGNQVI